MNRQFYRYARLRFLVVFLWSGVCVQAAEKLRVVAATSDLADIVTAVAGGHATVSYIADGTQDPHFLNAKPSFVLRARDADLWVAVGMGLEAGWEAPVINSSRNRRIRPGSRGYLDASEHVLRLEVPQEKLTRAMGDVHAEGNPHYWLDPLNGRLVAEAVAARLTELDPSHEPEYKKNLSMFVNALDSHMFGAELTGATGGDKLWAMLLDGTLAEYLNKEQKRAGGWYSRLAPHRGQQIVTYHRSWGYFTDRFGLRVAAELEPKPGVPPGPAHLLEIIKIIQQNEVRVILQEPFYSRKAADRVSVKTGAQTVVCPNSVGGGNGAGSYLGLIDTIVNQLCRAFETT